MLDDNMALLSEQKIISHLKKLLSVASQKGTYIFPQTNEHFTNKCVKIIEDRKVLTVILNQKFDL